MKYHPNSANNSTQNVAFLASIDSATKTAILKNIAAHYGITTQEAYNEVTDIEAENLLDYVTGPTRAATSALMQHIGTKNKN